MLRTINIIVISVLLVTAVSGRIATAQERREVNIIPMDECTSKTDPKGYPLHLDRIIQADTFARSTSASPNSKVRVVILDNGFVGYKEESGTRKGSKNFPEIFFYNRPPYAFRPFYPTTPLGEAKNKNSLVKGHGTHIAGIILGGMTGTSEPASPNDYTFPEIRRLLMYDPAKLKSIPGPSNSWLELYIYGLSADGESLDANGLEGLYASLQKLPRDFRPPEIMNVSLLYTPANEDVPPSVQTFPAQFPDTLVVASAGNLGTELMEGGSGHYPAMSLALDKALPVNLLVVGSHDSNLQRSTFSNYHSSRVNISAPGCAIKSWTTADKNSVPLNGTSQATALVTFAAALLRTHWGPVTPALLRERLLVSSRYSQDLAKGCPRRGDAIGACTLFGNVLDVEMSLYYNRDTIEFCTGGSAAGPDCVTEIVVGELRSVPKELRDCIGNAARTDPNERFDIGLSWPGAIRRTDFKHFEAIVRSKSPPHALVRVCESEVPSHNFEIMSDGEPKALRVIPSSSVVRVVTRSPYQQD